MDKCTVVTHISQVHLRFIHLTMSTATDTQTVITLKGSVAIVKDFFFTAINSILYQRGESQRLKGCYRYKETSQN
jgi:hypothetical protein